jgi:hypothetical protein
VKEIDTNKEIEMPSFHPAPSNLVDSSEESVFLAKVMSRYWLYLSMTKYFIVDKCPEHLLVTSFFPQLLQRFLYFSIEKLTLCICRTIISTFFKTKVFDRESCDVNSIYLLRK